MVLIFMVVVTAGCSTFFEEDISDQTVKLLSPANGISTDISSQTFCWERIEGASEYRFQLVTPSFDSTEALLMDTLLLDTLGSSNKINVTLYPSNFEWRVRAENSGWQTKWTTGKFQIYSTTDLTRQRINLLAPGLMANTTNTGFQWDALYNADNYSFVVYKENWDGVLAVPPVLLTSTYSGITLGDGKYVWGVMAKNTTSGTLYSQKSLIVDTTPPATAVLSSPADSSSVTNTTITFTWNSSDQTSGIARDTLKVFSDKSLKNLVKSVIPESKGAEISFTDRKEYYWTVRSEDKAGNAGKASDAYMFTIK